MSLFGVSSTTSWRKSSLCQANGTCVEVAKIATQSIGTRDAKLGEHSPVLEFSATDWRTFITQVKAGELSL